MPQKPLAFGRLDTRDDARDVVGLRFDGFLDFGLTVFWTPSSALGLSNIMPAATVALVRRSMRMKAPVA